MSEASYLWSSFLELIHYDVDRALAEGAVPHLRNHAEYEATLQALLALAQRPLVGMMRGESHYRANNRHHTQMLNAVSTSSTSGDLYEALDQTFRRYLSYELLFGWPHVAKAEAGGGGAAAGATPENDSDTQAAPPRARFQPAYVASQSKGQVQWMLPSPNTPRVPLSTSGSASVGATLTSPNPASGSPTFSSGGSGSVGEGSGRGAHPTTTNAATTKGPAAAGKEPATTTTAKRSPSGDKQQPPKQAPHDAGLSTTATTNNDLSSSSSRRGLLRVELHNCPRGVLQDSRTIFEDAMRVAKHYIAWSDKRFEEEDEEYWRAVGQAVARRRAMGTNTNTNPNGGGYADPNGNIASSAPSGSIGSPNTANAAGGGPQSASSINSAHKFEQEAYQNKLAQFRHPRRTIRKKFVLIAGGDKFGGDNLMRQWKSNPTSSSRADHQQQPTSPDDGSKHSRRTVLVETHGTTRYRVNPVTEWVKKSTYADTARGGEPSTLEEDVWVLQCTDMDADTTIVTLTQLISTYITQVGRVVGQQQPAGTATSSAPEGAEQQQQGQQPPSRRIGARPLDNHFSSNPNADTRLIIQVIIAADFSHQTVKTPTALAALRNTFVPMMDRLYNEMIEKDAALFPACVSQVLFRVEVVIANAPVAISNPEGGPQTAAALSKEEERSLSDTAKQQRLLQLEQERRQLHRFGECARLCRELFLTLQYPCISVVLDMPATAFFCGIEVPAWGTGSRDVEAVNILFARVHRGVGEGSQDAARIIIHRGMDVSKDDHLASTVSDKHTEGVALNNLMFHFWALAPAAYRAALVGEMEAYRYRLQQQQQIAADEGMEGSGRHQHQHHLLHRKPSNTILNSPNPSRPPMGASADVQLKPLNLPSAGSADGTLLNNGSFNNNSSNKQLSSNTANSNVSGMIETSSSGPGSFASNPLVAGNSSGGSKAAKKGASSAIKPYRPRPLASYEAQHDTSILRGYRIYGSIMNGVGTMLVHLATALGYQQAPCASSRNPLQPSNAPLRSLGDVVYIRRCDPALVELVLKLEVVGRRMAAASSAELMWLMVRACFNTVGIHVMLQTQTSAEVTDAANAGAGGGGGLTAAPSEGMKRRNSNLATAAAATKQGGREGREGSADPSAANTAAVTTTTTDKPTTATTTTTTITAANVAVTEYTLELNLQPFQHFRHAALLNSIHYVGPLLANALFPLWDLVTNIRVRLFQTLRDGNRAMALMVAGQQQQQQNAAAPFSTDLSHQQQNGSSETIPTLLLGSRSALLTSGSVMAAGGGGGSGTATAVVTPALLDQQRLSAIGITPTDGVLFPIPIIGDYDDGGVDLETSLDEYWLQRQEAAYRDAGADDDGGRDGTPTTSSPSQQQQWCANHPTYIYNSKMERKAACSTYIPMARLIVVPRGVVVEALTAEEARYKEYIRRQQQQGASASAATATAAATSSASPSPPPPPPAGPTDGEEVLSRCAFTEDVLQSLEVLANEFTAFMADAAARMGRDNIRAQREVLAGGSKGKGAPTTATSGGGGSYSPRQSPAAGPTPMATPSLAGAMPPANSASSLPQQPAAAVGNNPQKPVASLLLPPAGDTKTTNPTATTTAQQSLPLPLAEYFVARVIDAHTLGTPASAFDPHGGSMMGRDQLEQRGNTAKGLSASPSPRQHRAPTIEIGLLVDFNDLANSFNCSYDRMMMGVGVGGSSSNTSSSSGNGGVFCPHYKGYSLSGSAAEWHAWLRAMVAAFAGISGGSYQRAEAAALSRMGIANTTSTLSLLNTNGGVSSPLIGQQRTLSSAFAIHRNSNGAGGVGGDGSDEQPEEQVAKLTGLWAALGGMQQQQQLAPTTNGGAASNPDDLAT